MTDPKACKKSIQTLKEAIRINPQDVRLYRKLGALYEHMNLDAQAFEILKHAARMDRANASGWEALGAVALRMNHMEEAWKAWREAARLNPARAETFMGLGLVYNRMGRFKDAMHMCQIALRLSPDDALALNHLGEACSGLKDHAGAEQAYLLSVRSKPTLPALSNLGKLYMGLCQYDKAIAAYRRITQLAPQDTEARMGLGLAYAQLGNLSAAIQQSDMLRPLSKAMARDLDAKISKLSSRIA
jgi:Flp pilus assembly protein TadD